MKNNKVSNSKIIIKFKPRNYKRPVYSDKEIQAIKDYFQNNKELFVQISQIVAIAAKQARQQMEGIMEVIGKTLEPITAIQESLKPMVSIWTKWLDDHQVIFRDFYDSLERFKKEYDIAEKDAFMCMYKYKWFISPTMPPSLIFAVVQFARRKGNQSSKVNKLFINLIFGNNYEFLDYLLEKWRVKLDEARYKIIKDVFSFIKSAPKSINVANISIPVLLAQIDGIMLEFLQKHGLNTGKYEQRKKALRGHSKSILTEKMSELANDLWLEILFQKSVTGKPLKNPFQLNRHKILHGEHRHYGKRSNLVRVILVLDYVVHLQ